MKRKNLLTLALTALVFAALLSACGGGGGGSSVISDPTNTGPGPNPPNAVVTLSTVTAQFPAHGANWNDYVKGGSLAAATDTLCSAATDTACVHAGELRKVVVTGKTTCANLTATDSLSAFNWKCDDGTGTVQFISTGLNYGKHLSDLLDFAAPGWKPNSVTVVESGTAYAVTPSTTWWSNPVAVDNDGGSLSTAGTIYTITTDVTSTYTIDASSVAMVVQPGSAVKGPGGSLTRLVSANNRNFIWIEGAFNMQGDDCGISWNLVKFSVLSNVTANNAGDTNKRALLIYGASYSKFIDISTSNNGETGFWLNNCNNNQFVSIRSSNNGFYGLELYSSSDNVFANVVTAQNANYGFFSSASSNNVFLGITSGNTGSVYSGSGVYLTSSNKNTLLNVATANNGNDGLDLISSSNNIVSNFASDSATYDVYSSGSSTNYFTGLLKINGHCYAAGGSSPGLVTWTCTQTGTAGSSDYGSGNSSDAVFTPGITLTSSVVGKIVSDDAVNTIDSNGASAFPVSPAAFDWSGFQTSYRMWGKDGTAGNADSRGAWLSGAGRIWDWSLLGSDSIVRNVVPVPTGNDTLTHRWSNGAAIVYLRNAVELTGNGNGLCESGETCLYTPNIGAYQGHGNLVSAGAFSNGAITGVTLLKYETNGW